MKESEKYVIEKKSDAHGIIGSSIVAIIILGILACLAIKGDYAWFVAILIFSSMIIGSCLSGSIEDYRRAKKMEMLWQQAESGENPQLQKKCQIYEAALQNIEGYKKDVARMEARAKSIKAEIEAEIKK